MCLLISLSIHGILHLPTAIFILTSTYKSLSTITVLFAYSDRQGFIQSCPEFSTSKNFFISRKLAEIFEKCQIFRGLVILYHIFWPSESCLGLLTSNFFLDFSVRVSAIDLEQKLGKFQPFQYFIVVQAANTLCGSRLSLIDNRKTNRTHGFFSLLLFSRPPGGIFTKKSRKVLVFVIFVSVKTTNRADHNQLVLVKHVSGRRISLLNFGRQHRNS